MTKDPWRYRLTVRTEPSQGLNTGSIPVSATNSSITYGWRAATRGAPEKLTEDLQPAPVSSLAGTPPTSAPRLYPCFAGGWVCPRARAYTRCVTPTDRSYWQTACIWRPYRNNWA